MADKKPISKHQLEIRLAKLKILENPTLSLEQYPVSPEVASELLHMAGFEHNDLDGRTIDLGTGTGRLAIGAALMGSNHVVGIDVDNKALALARENAKTASVDIEWVQSSIDEVDGAYDTAIMNPPYGTRTPHADIRFLNRAFHLAPVTYTIHKSSTRDFLSDYVKRSNQRIDEACTMNMLIPHLYGFHERMWKSIEVDLCRIVR